MIDFVMKAEGVSFRHAVELLRRGADLAESGQPKPVVKGLHRRKLEPLAGQEASDAELLGQVADHYHASLLESDDAQRYLRGRGLEHADLAATFRLGFANRTLGYRLPASQLKAGQLLRTRLARLGVLRATGHEHLRGSLVVPLLGTEGEVVQLYGRKIDDHIAPDVPRHLYLPGAQRGVFNRAGLAGAEEAILCEALIDALTFWCAGYHAVTSGYGVEGVTEEILDALEAAGVVRVKIAFDRDEAGGSGRVQGVGAAERARDRELPGGVSARDGRERLRAEARPCCAEPWARAAASRVDARRPEQGEADAELAERGPLSFLSRLFFRAAGRRPPVLEPSEVQNEVPASALPAPATTSHDAATPTPAPTVERNGEDLFLVFGDRKWRVRAAGKSSGSELKVNLLVSDERHGGGFYVDTVDLYAARQRVHYVKSATAELGADELELRREVGAVVLEVEAERRAAVAQASTPLDPVAAMTEDERVEALELLRDPKALRAHRRGPRPCRHRGRRDEQARLLPRRHQPQARGALAVVIQSSSAAGKSSLMEAVLALIPEEERVQYSAMTGQSLFYMSGKNLKHKILAIVEEEGAERASYALKLLQSEGELTIASTGKDPSTGRHVTQTYRVEGPVMIVLTTTASEVDEELLNRCLVLTVDEGREQTRLIHDRQRRAQTLAGLLERDDRQHLRRLHRNAQRLLQPVFVVNPFAPDLDFASHVTRTRRDHMKYLTLIRAVTLLHQHQRPLKTTTHRGRRVDYIEASREDVEIATRLARAVLGRSLDELPPQTRRLLGEISAMVARHAAHERIEPRAVRFTQRDVREWTRWGQTQIKVHMKRLEEHEYLLSHRSRGPLVIYELAHAGGEAEGLLVGPTTHAYDHDWSGSEADRSGLGRPTPRPDPTPRDLKPNGAPLAARSA
ncbi:MAG: toprim domain-containing protein [Polyangiaceae bacterium]|nr:toprim domain-containing protein [Polyangiaceae bacterium]